MQCKKPMQKCRPIWGSLRVVLQLLKRAGDLHTCVDTQFKKVDELPNICTGLHYHWNQARLALCAPPPGAFLGAFIPFSSCLRPSLSASLLVHKVHSLCKWINSCPANTNVHGNPQLIHSHNLTRPVSTLIFVWCVCVICFVRLRVSIIPSR